MSSPPIPTTPESTTRIYRFDRGSTPVSAPACLYIPPHHPESPSRSGPVHRPTLAKKRPMSLYDLPPIPPFRPYKPT
jgi:hypothetical protein